MTGIARSKEQLNEGLTFLCEKLHKHNVNKWFIGYGTLLGIVRDGTCIDGDDDLDIVVDVTEIAKVRSLITHLIENNGFKITIDKKEKFMQISCKSVQIDFYFADVDSAGNFFDLHEKVTWSECLIDNKVPTIKWLGTDINVPNNRIEKLQNRYGEHWRKRIPKHEPGGEGYRTVSVL